MVINIPVMVSGLEQQVVPWTKDDDEKTCRECRRKFGVQRRKHHCRLCGYIICKQCSHFMTLGQTCKWGRGREGESCHR